MKTLKVSSKMRRSIERLEKKYGTLNKSYGTESNNSLIENEKFYCYCDLSCDILKNLSITVSFDGKIN